MTTTPIYLRLSQIAFNDDGNIAHIAFGEFADPVSGSELAAFVRDYAAAMHPGGDQDDAPAESEDGE